MKYDLGTLIALIDLQKPQLRQQYGVKKIGVFGSYLRQEQTRHSDLDILVEFERTIDLFDFVALKDFLTDYLSIEVDLVMQSSLKPVLKEMILREVRYI